MTAAARISGDDMKRAAKAVKAAGFDRARIVMDLAAQKITVIIGEADADSPPPEEWDDDDV